MVSSCAAFESKNGEARLASGAWDGVVRVWDPFSDHVGYIEGSLFSGRFLIGAKATLV